MRRTGGKAARRQVPGWLGWIGVGGGFLLASGLLAALPRGRLAAQIAITDATIYPVSGPKIEHGSIVIQDGKIVAVGKDVSIPSGARRIDGRGKVVTPGFIHLQSELGLGVGRALVEETDQEYSAIGGTSDGDQKGDVSAAFNVTAAIDPAAVGIPVARMGGITTVLTMPSDGLISGQAVALHLFGEHTDEMILANPALMVADLSDQSRIAGGGSRAGALARLKDILRDAQELRRRTPAYTENRIQPLSAPAADLEALYPVLDGKLPLYVRARRQSDIENTVKLAQDLHLNVVIRGATEAWRSAAILAKAQIPVVLDTRDNIPSFDGLRARSDNATILREAGVTIILAGQDPGGQMNLRFEAGHAVRNGMKWDDALESVTLAPAKALGIASRFGSLEPGKTADLVLWSGDPFEFSTGVDLLLIDGHETPTTSRMTELRERYRTLPPRY